MTRYYYSVNKILLSQTKPQATRRGDTEVASKGITFQRLQLQEGSNHNFPQLKTNHFIVKRNISKQCYKNKLSVASYSIVIDTNQHHGSNMENASRKIVT